MVTFKAKVQVVGKVSDELIQWKATVKADGTRREAGEMRKVFCTGILDGEMAILRFDMRKHKELPLLSAGESVIVAFNTVTIENDITQVNVLAIEKK